MPGAAYPELLNRLISDRAGLSANCLSRVAAGDLLGQQLIFKTSVFGLIPNDMREGEVWVWLIATIRRLAPEWMSKYAPCL